MPDLSARVPDERLDELAAIVEAHARWPRSALAIQQSQYAALVADLRAARAALADYQETSWRDLRCENKRLREAIIAVHRACPDYGAEGCSCGTHGTPARECPLHWAIWVLEHRDLDYDQSGARESDNDG